MKTRDGQLRGGWDQGLSFLKLQFLSLTFVLCLIISTLYLLLCVDLEWIRMINREGIG